MRLSLRIRKLCFALATGLCLAGAAAILAWGTKPLAPLATAAAQSATHVATSRELAATHDREPTRDDFASLWDRPLRRALYDPPPPPPVVRELPPLGVELLGTIIEPDNSMALVRSEQGSVEYKRVGDIVGPVDSPASVVEIGAESIIVERAEERITLGVRGSERR